ncbi:hypothetical protein COTS27_00152 [Spirochaetota bacterium]|nr:hypothetical protein COTS27_00152 [Spirochaetota bacterium]
MNRSVLNKKINKENIHALKRDRQHLTSFLHKQSDSAIIYLLEKLGRLESEFSSEPLVDLLKHSNETIRSLAIKNLAKVNAISLLGVFAASAKNDTSTEVRREAVSAIGRLRNEKAISILIDLVSDQDPKVVMQAIRGLLVFPTNIEAKKELVKLKNHPNELIKEIISKEVDNVSCVSVSSEHHDKFPLYLKNTIVHSDVMNVFKHIPDEAVHLTFTSPPYYNARDYSIYQSYEEYLRFLEGVFLEVHRITKEGRFFVLNTSPIIIPRISRAHASKRYAIPYDIHPYLIKMGWEFIDDIVWVKPEASAKNRNAGFLQHRKPLGYKPNAISEMVMVYRKKTGKLIDWNIRQYGSDKTKESRVLGKYETTNVWYISPAFNRFHKAVFPIELCERVIKYYSFVNDLVFDPFAGIGTLGKAAIDLNRNYFLTEQEAQYVSHMKEDFSKRSSLLRLDRVSPRFVNLADFVMLCRKENP